MDVLYVSKTSIHAGGGSEKKADIATLRLADRGHDVTVICGKTDPSVPAETTRDGRTVKHVACVPDSLLDRPVVGFYAPRYLFAFFSLPILAAALWRRDYDIFVEDQTPFPMFGILLGKLFGVPVVAHQHEFYDRSCYRVFDPLTATIQLALQNFLRIFEYAGLVVPSSHVAHQYARYGVPPDRIYTITNGIDAQRYRRPDIDIEPGELAVLSRVTKRKGHGTVIRAVATLRKVGHDVHLHVIGDGPDRGALEELTTDLGIDGAVTFHGYVAEERKIELLNRADLFLFASRQEGLGNVLLEAMAARCVVVARWLPVYEDFFTDRYNGLLVEDAGHAELADAAEQLLTDPDRAERMREANAETVQQFTWEEYTAQFEAALREASSNGDHSESTIESPQIRER